MEKTGRKKVAGGWLRGQFLSRIASAGMLTMAVVGCGLGFLVRGLPVFDGPAGSLASWLATGAMVLAFRLFYAYCRRVDATWGRGLEAERQIGDFIDHAVAQQGCAVAHDVKEALGGRGNVDHIVMTPAGVWLVETKSGWLSKRRFRQALRQVAENVCRVRSHLETSLPVRGALVIANRSNDSLEARHPRARQTDRRWVQLRGGQCLFACTHRPIPVSRMSYANGNSARRQRRLPDAP